MICPYIIADYISIIAANQTQEKPYAYQMGLPVYMITGMSTLL